MSKFCGECGAQLLDEAIFCPECGTKQETAGGAVISGGLEKKKIIIIGVLAAVIIIALILFAATSGKKGYEKPIDRLCKGLARCNANEILDVFPPYLKMEVRDNFENSYSENGEEMQDAMTNFRESLISNVGQNYEISYEIISAMPMSERELVGFEYNVIDNYNEKINIKEGYYVNATLILKGEEDYSSSDEEFYIGKIGSNWYFLNTFIL